MCKLPENKIQLVLGEYRCCRFVYVRRVAGSDLALVALPGTTKDMRPVFFFFWQGLNQQQVGFDSSTYGSFVCGLRQSETLGTFLYTGRKFFDLNSYY